MDKYSVLEEPESKDAKTATSVAQCPVCAANLESAANVKKCPNCGTKPFETAAPYATK